MEIAGRGVSQALALYDAAPLTPWLLEESFDTSEVIEAAAEVEVDQEAVLGHDEARTEVERVAASDHLRLTFSALAKAAAAPECSPLGEAEGVLGLGWNCPPDDEGDCTLLCTCIQLSNDIQTASSRTCLRPRCSLALHSTKALAPILCAKSLPISLVTE